MEKAEDTENQRQSEVLVCTTRSVDDGRLRWCCRLTHHYHILHVWITQHMKFGIIIITVHMMYEHGLLKGALVMLMCSFRQQKVNKIKEPNNLYSHCVLAITGSTMLVYL